MTGVSEDAKSKFASLLALCLYMASSSALIILNKQLMVDDGFGFPLFLTAAGQIASIILGNGYSSMSRVHRRVQMHIKLFLLGFLMSMIGRLSGYMSGSYTSRGRCRLSSY